MPSDLPDAVYESLKAICSDPDGLTAEGVLQGVLIAYDFPKATISRLLKGGDAGLYRKPGCYAVRQKFILQFPVQGRMGGVRLEEVFDEAVA